jgi:hypothetical protein
MPFDTAIRTKVLLWSDRHCCLCKKPCGPNIAVHHIVPESADGANDLDNAIPLCFDCHGRVHQYDPACSVGTKYKPDELKARRDQVYEEFTRQLVPPIHYELTQTRPGQKPRDLPDVGFLIAHLGDSLPVKVRVRIESDQPGRLLRLPAGYYTGETLWHLNPRFTVLGHFELPSDSSAPAEAFTLTVHVGIIDQYDREHRQLPLGYTYIPNTNCWILEPRGGRI